MILLSLALADAAEHRVARTGDTVETLALLLGDAGLASTIRELNGLAEGEQPIIGAVLVLPSPAPHDEEGGVVLSLTGTATASPVGGEQLSVEQGTELPLGSTVCTEADSYATLRLTAERHGADHDEITLMEETCVVVAGSGASYGQRTALVSLEQGSIDVRLSDEPGQLAIQTIDGITAATGGGFRVEKEAEATRTEAVTAPVSVMGAGVEVKLEAGQGSRVVAGQAPSSPVQLPGAVALATPQDGDVLLVPHFEWVQVERALAYRLEISTEPDFTALVYVEEVEDTPFEPELLFLPYRVPGLWWRVSSVDLNGFMGGPSTGSLLQSPGGSTL